MPRHLISDAHEWINEIPTVPIYYLAKPQPRERTWENQRGKKKATRKVNTKPSSSEDDSSEDEQSIPESSSDESSSERKGKIRRVAKYVTRIRRMRRKTKHVRKTSQAPRYEVEVVVNGEVTKAFADTGADIPVMSRACAKKLGLKLCKTKMKICYNGTVMHGDHVANVCISEARF